MRKKKKWEVVKDLEVTDINVKGMGVAKTAEGRVYFVKNTVPGDVVDAIPYKKRSGYFEANVSRWISESEVRVAPPCTHFGVCGGCKWQHLDYDAQLHFKQHEIDRNLLRIGGVEAVQKESIVKAESPYFYRNKMEFSFSNRRWLRAEEIESDEVFERNGLGFHIPGMWDKVVDIHDCHLQANPSNAIRNAIRDFAIENKLPFFDSKAQQGFLRSLMIRNTKAGAFMVLIQFFYEDKPLQETLLNFVKDQFPEIQSLLYCVNSKPNDTLYDQEIKLFSGQDFLMETLRNLTFKITAKSFYQTNSYQVEKLYEVVEEFAGLKGDEIVYDLYSGIGTITLFLAHQCVRIVGVESVPEAVTAAKENAVTNKIENASFVVGDMKTIFNDAFTRQWGQPDVVVTDPPRNGMHLDVVKQLLRLAPKKIVYVSCNSATQARDLGFLKTQYRLTKSRAVDMFPQTHHVENVVLLERIQNDDTID